ncbi:cyclic nucleotide-binding-like protein [Phlyctochytrium arcticum]|nr:cyclic nucleotide-binding-like protein [Phlyctochytrium arcticum]
MAVNVLQKSFSSDFRALGLPTGDTGALITHIHEQDEKVLSLQRSLQVSESERLRMETANKMLRDRLAFVQKLQEHLRITLKTYDDITSRIQEHLRLTQQLQNLVEDASGDVKSAVMEIPTFADLDKVIEDLTESGGLHRRGRSGSSAAASVPTPDTIVPILMSFPLFAEFPQEVLMRLARYSYEMRRAAGQPIITKGDMGAEIFFIEEGQADVMTQLPDGAEVPLATLNASQFFGELGVLFDNPRSATVQARTDCRLLVLTKQKIDEVLQNFPDCERRVRQFAEDKATWWNAQSYKQGFGGEFITNIAKKDISKIPIFAEASDDFLDQLGMSVTSEMFPAEQIIIATGDDSDCIFFIIRGAVQVLGPNNEVHAEMSAGSFFGEVGIILNMKRTASIKAKEDSYLLKLTKESLTRVQDLFPAMKQKIQEAVEDRYALYKGRAQASNKTPEQFHMEVGHQQLNKVD